MHNSYQRLCTLYYDLDKPAAPENELQFYMNYAYKSPGTILEPMCGTGRFLIPMLESGLDIEGFDASEYMLTVLQQKSTQKNLKTLVWQQWLQEFCNNKKYGLIFIPSGSFGLIIDPQQAHDCLQTLYNHLLPHGKLVFEIETPSAYIIPHEIWQHSYVRQDALTSIALHSLPSYNPTTQIVSIRNHYQLLHNNIIVQEEVEDFNVKLYNFDELDSYLITLGFEIIKYKGCTQEHPQPNNPIITYECTKN